MVLFDKATYDKLLTEAPKYKLITPSVLSDRLRVRYFDLNHDIVLIDLNHELLLLFQLVNWIYC